jgi:hypothetical protein
MCAVLSRTSASGVGKSNMAPCTLITTLPNGGVLSVFNPAVCAVWVSDRVLWLCLPRGRVCGWGGSRVCRMCLDRSPWLCHRDVDTYTRVGFMLWRVGLTVSLNFHAHIRMFKSVRDPGYTLPLTLWWRVLFVYNLSRRFAGNVY